MTKDTEFTTSEMVNTEAQVAQVEDTDPSELENPEYVDDYQDQESDNSGLMVLVIKALAGAAALGAAYWAGTKHKAKEPKEKKPGLIARIVGRLQKKEEPVAEPAASAEAETTVVDTEKSN